MAEVQGVIPLLQRNDPAFGNLLIPFFESTKRSSELPLALAARLLKSTVDAEVPRISELQALIPDNTRLKGLADCKGVIE